MESQLLSGHPLHHDDALRVNLATRGRRIQNAGCVACCAGGQILLRATDAQVHSLDKNVLRSRLMKKVPGVGQKKVERREARASHRSERYEEQVRERDT